MKENPRDLLQKRLERLAMVYMKCLRGGGQESLNVTLSQKEKGSPQKDLIELRLGFLFQTEN